MSEIVRVIRLIEYVGEREWVESSIDRREIKGTWISPRGTIREAIIGDFPEVVTPAEDAT